MEGLVLCWIGEKDAQAGLIETVRAHLGSELRVNVATGFEPERPGEAWDPRRRQYETGRILKWLESRHADASKVLGLTDVDLFIPILTFVFGEAQLGGRAAVVSTARLASGNGARGRTPARRAFPEGSPSRAGARLRARPLRIPGVRHGPLAGGFGDRSERAIVLQGLPAPLRRGAPAPEVTR